MNYPSDLEREVRFQRRSVEAKLAHDLGRAVTDADRSFMRFSIDTRRFPLVTLISSGPLLTEIAAHKAAIG